jgi:predicted ATPase/class 3 adenylate cyclase
MRRRGKGALAHHDRVRRDLPTGDVTFLFTDVEGSTKLLQELGEERYADALAVHRRTLREAFGAHEGVEVDTQGDSFFVAFPTAQGALQAAIATLKGLAAGPIKVRMGLHTGTARVGDEGYVGVDVHRAARIAASGHGGQVLISASTAELIGTDGLRDLGYHRLKDLSEAERIYQLGDEEFPPLESLHRTNLPLPSTPFLGRRQELAEALAQLSRPEVRLLTLTGPGGTGKTRLALHIAGELAARYPHGVWWVPLAPLRDPQLVVETAAQALGAEDGLVEYIAEKSLLIVFDNFEQVVDAAADVAALLSACPNLDLLVTSREPLRVNAEQLYEVPPLAPDEGVSLFLARAKAVKPDFADDESISEICRRLDDLPLALELAAARVKALSSDQILERLSRRLPLLTGGARDLPERQRTLGSAIDWSYELLTPVEQRAFARLSTFAGGCTLADAEQVADADLDTLQSLVDKSLLRHAGGRFSMLETIREYAAGQLEESGQAEELERRHAEHFLALVESAEPRVREGSKEWLDRLEQEHDNLRAALERLEALGELQLALRIAGAMSDVWYHRGHVAEGRRRLESLLLNDERPTAARGKALNGASRLAVVAGDVSIARLRAEEGLALNRRLENALGTADSLWRLSYALAADGDFANAQRLLLECIPLYGDLGEEHAAIEAVRDLAWTNEEIGDLSRARELYEDGLLRARAQDNTRLEARLLGGLAVVAVDEGRAEEARSLLQENFPMYRQLDDLRGTGENLCRCAHALAAVGEAATAARLLGGSEAVFEGIGASPPWLARMNDQTLAAIREQLDEVAIAEAREHGRALTVDEAVALALESLG